MVNAIMALVRDGNVYLSDFRVVPNYHVITWIDYNPEIIPQEMLDAILSNIRCQDGVFTVWTAPMNASRFEIPVGVRQRAAEAGISIRV